MIPVFLALLLATSWWPSSALAQASAWQTLLGGDDANTPRMPSGVAVDAQGAVFIVDTSGSRIEKVSAAGRLQTTFGRLGPDDAGLRRPRGIALASSGDLYIADTANHRIQRFSSSGEPLGPWGTIGSGPGEFILPSSVAFDSTGNLYVADTGNHRIQKLSADGQMLAQWGGVHFPHGITLDAHDDVYVSDEAGVRKFTSEGGLLAAWISPGQFGDPYGLASDGAGTIYVADTDNGRILALSTNGELQAAWASEGKDLGQLKYPEAVAIDGQGAVYVADRGNDRVQVFRPGL